MDIGDRLTEFKLKDRDNRPHSSNEFSDAFTFLLLFYADNCPISKSYEERIKKLILQYEEDDLGIMLINIAPDASNSILKPDSFKLEGLRDKYIICVNDFDRKITQKFGVQVTPEAFLFNSKKEMVYHGAIDDAWENSQMVTRVYLEDALEYALDGFEIDYPEISPVGTPVKKVRLQA